MFRFGILLPLCLLITSNIARAESELGVRWGVGLTEAFSVPEGGLEKKQLAPTREIFANFGGSESRGSSDWGPRIGLFVASTATWAKPIYGFDGEYTFVWHPFKLRVGGGFTNSQDLQGTPYNGSVFDIYAAEAMVEIGLEFWTRTYASLSYRDIKLGSSDLPSVEQNAAAVAHNDTSVQKIAIESGWLEPLLLAASYEHYWIGAAAVGSKDFVMKIDDNKHVSRTMLGAGLRLSRLELWGRYYRVFGIDDKTAFPYQFPILRKDYLMSKNFVVAEAKWIF